MNLRARWIGPPPRVGDYLMSAVRPRYAYRVTQVDAPTSIVQWDATAKGEVRRLKIVVDRVTSSAVPPHARIHSWKWDKRESRSKGALR